jgi:hypothetical protein
MATPQIAPTNEDVLAVLRRHPDGATPAQIEQELSPRPELRMLQYTVGVMAEQRQIVNVGTTRAPRYRVGDLAPGVSAAVAPATPVRRPTVVQAPQPVPSPVAEQRLGATAIGVDQEQVTELVDLIIAARVPAVGVKPYVRQAARGLPNANEFVAAVLAELTRRGGPTG